MTELRQLDPVDFERELFLSKEDLRPHRVAQRVAATQQQSTRRFNTSNVIPIEQWRDRLAKLRLEREKV